MRVLLDTNVILDVWLAREPFWKDSASLLAKAERKEIEGWICPTTITTLHYLGKKVLGEKKTRSLLDQLITICKVGRVSRQTFKLALESKISDFEDAVIEAVSIGNEVEFIATRNVVDFKKSRIPAKEPSQIKQRIGQYRQIATALVLGATSSADRDNVEGAPRTQKVNTKGIESNFALSHSSDHCTPSQKYL